ncbi:capsid protein [Faeces associated gemycircularvirus 11]|uniref:Capsid protein n=1 Tax=Faeces associated gemycircularvirus 11 TaxID=1391026 RepID=T1YSE5_9VIRU|nr:capsid protein [Faeces associated gemycircularvirus 11]AGU67648.1 capsid protein [Faeces associated gemycircularvirus 11]
MPRYAKRTSKKRPAYRKKAAYRGKKRTYSKKTSSSLAKKIHAVADTKKSDTMACAIAAPVTGANPSGVEVKEFMDWPLDSQIKIYMWAPLYRVGTDKKGPHLRNASRVHFTGVSERMNIASNSRVPFRHRRLVIRAAVDFTSRMLASKADPTLVFRNLDQLTPTALDTYFLGQKNLDWSDPIKADVDKQQLTVLFDKTYTYNPPNDFGLDSTRTSITRLTAKVGLPTRKDGVNTKWSAKIGTKEPNDVVIIDMFRSNYDTRTNTFPLGIESWTIGSKCKGYLEGT